jgi:endonuclease/exonuclease/phosphatase family metal-dependent hydrolase
LPLPFVCASSFSPRLLGFRRILRRFALLAALALLLLSCTGTMQNYDHPSEPLFAGEFAPAPSADADQSSVKVVTWNIKFGEQIDEAIETLISTPELADADIYLLQEMDESGTEEIARALGQNYVYFPASVHTQHGRNFGNAILARWPISHPQKVILPNRNPRNGQLRTATRAVVTLGEIRVLTYSVHTETFWLGSKGRVEQVDAVAETVAFQYDYVVVGGDFNTLTPASVRTTEQRMARFDLVRLSKDAGYTVGVRNVGMPLDHIFGSDVNVLASGVWRETTASDHYPLWVQLGPPPEDEEIEESSE